MAVTTQTRETGAIASIVNSHTNDWEDFAGIDINVEAVYSPVDVSDGDWDITHWSYRGQAAMTQIANGDIVRVRVGDWTNTAYRGIQRQVITDPTDPSQWQTWSNLYAGDHYAVAIERDDSAVDGYHIYSSKSDGLYMDNVGIVTGGAAPYQIVRIKPVYGKTNMIYFAAIRQASDGLRAMSWYYVIDTLAPGTPNSDLAQFSYYHQDMFVVVHERDSTQEDFSGQRWRAMPLDSAERDPYASDTLTQENTGTTQDFDPEFGHWAWFEDGTFDYLKGPSQRAGFKRINDLYVTNISNDEFPNGAWYLFYTEQHLDAHGNVLSNLKNPLFWHRAAMEDAHYQTESGFEDRPILAGYWTQAVPIGYTIWGFAGVVVSGGYIYLAGNGRVLRVLLNTEETEISDYLIEGSYEMPRENGKGTGRLTFANPDNYIGELLGMSSSSTTGPLTERKLKFALGLRRPDEDYVYKRDAEWWIAGIRKYVTDDNKQRIELEIGDFWHKLENPFRDTWHVPGRFDWNDWQPDADNKLENYTNDTDQFTSYNPVGQPSSTVPRLRTVASGERTGAGGGTVTLFAGFRDSNAALQCILWAAGGIVFRYKDPDDFYLVYVSSTGTYLHHITEGFSASNVGNSAFAIAYETSDDAKIDTVNGTLLNVIFLWNHFEFYVGSGAGENGQDGQIIQLPDTYSQPTTGMVGFYSKTLIEASNFIITQPNKLITSRELLKMLLAYVGEHDVQFESTEETLSSPQIDMLYGPQSDLDTPEKGVRQLLETARLNVVWRQDEE